jgi:hypothetical protein
MPVTALKQPQHIAPHSCCIITKYASKRTASLLTCTTCFRSRAELSHAVSGACDETWPLKTSCLSQGCKRLGRMFEIGSGSQSIELSRRTLLAANHLQSFARRRLKCGTTGSTRWSEPPRRVHQRRDSWNRDLCGSPHPQFGATASKCCRKLAGICESPYS